MSGGPPAPVAVAVERRLDGASAEHAFETVAPIDLTLVFTGWGPLPAVVGVEDAPPSWDAPGLTRRPRFSDGGSASERLTGYEPPRRFAYELTDFTAPLGLVVERVAGEWVFVQDATGVQVRWTYAFHPRPGRRWLLRAVLAPLWRRYATRCLARVADLVEGSGSRERPPRAILRP